MMRRKVRQKVVSLALTTLVLLVSACAKENSSEVEQSRIFTSYSLSYDDTNHSLDATAIFNFGGSTGTYLVLDGSSAIQFDGQSMPMTTTIANQAIYESKLNQVPSAQVWGTHSFWYRNNDGSSFNNSLTLPALPTLQLPSTTISESATTNVGWTLPSPLGADGLSLNLSGSEGAQNLFVENPAVAPGGRSGTLSLTPAELQGLTPGQYSAQLCHWVTSVPTQAPQAGGSQTVTSCAALQSVTLTQ